MEVREILVANTRTQKRSKITTNATTLGELKAALDAEGIDYSGMTFTEGISKTQLLDDATQLPHDVMYKGNPTNNLVILLTNTKKNIASGVSDRQAAYTAVKNNNLQEAVKVHFGRNFTQVPTEALWDFIENHVALSAPTEAELEREEEVNPIDTYDKEEEDYTLADYILDMPVGTIEQSIIHHIAILANKGALESSDISDMIKDLANILILVEKKEDMANIDELSVKAEPVSTSDGSITDEDIDDMISDIL